MYYGNKTENSFFISKKSLFHLKIHLISPFQHLLQYFVMYIISIH